MPKTVMNMTNEEIITEYENLMKKRKENWNTIENDLLNKNIDELTVSEYEHAIDIRHKQLKEDNLDKIQSLKGDLQDKLVKDVFPAMSLEQMIQERDAFLQRWVNNLMDAKIGDIMQPSYILLLEYFINQKQGEVNND